MMEHGYAERSDRGGDYSAPVAGLGRVSGNARIGILLDAAGERDCLIDMLEQAGRDIVILDQPESMCASRLAQTPLSMVIFNEWGAHRHRKWLFQLKQSMHPLTLPLLLLLPEKALARAYLRAGFDDVVRLPLRADELYARMEVHLRLRRQSELALAESEKLFDTTFDMAPLGIAYVSLDGSIVRTNAAFNAILGYYAGSLHQRAFSSLVTDGVSTNLLSDMDSLLFKSSGAVCADEQRCLCFDGNAIWCSIKVTLMQDAIGAPKYFIVIMEDISARKRSEIRLHESERFSQATMDALSTHICVVDASGTILAVNQAWRNFALNNGASPDYRAEGINYLQICEQATGDALHTATCVAQGIRAVVGGLRTDFEMQYCCPSPHGQRWFAFKVTRFPDNGPVRAVITHLDVTERELAAARLLHLAYHDALTALPNRLLFEDRVNQAIGHAEHNGWSVAVLFLDVDRFKLVNDTLGHSAGDRLLQEVARRLSLCLRNGDTLGRVGGDEFVVLLPNLRVVDASAVVVQKLMAALEQPMLIDTMETYVTISLGIALYPRDGATTEVLIKNADAAMYRAKENGRNTHQYFFSEMHDRTHLKMQLGNSLQRALERQELFLQYQPQIELCSGHMVGAEALVRWNHPLLGLVSPAQFIPLAEENGLIVAIGEWVMQEACVQNKAWQDAGLPPIRVAVNMSARQLMKADVVEVVRRTLAHSGLEARFLELELTESMMMERTEQTITTLRALKALGVHISIDDFGTGYSNLGYLEQFPLDTLKIDKSFVHRIEAGPGQGASDGTIARTVIYLAHSLGLQVVAEGVENEEQLSFLRQHGCDMVQGFYFSRPLLPEALQQLLGREGGSG